LALLAWRLRKSPLVQIQARWLGGLVLLQLATGLSNVVLGWPMAAAILHTGGAAALVAVLVWMIAVHAQSAAAPSKIPSPSRMPARLTP